MNSIDKATLFKTMGLGPVWELKSKSAGVKPAAPGAASSDGFDQVPIPATGVQGKLTSQQIQACTACPRCEQRKQPIFQMAEHGTPVMVIGGAPNAQDDDVGEPFAGAHGDLLVRLLNAIDLDKNKQAGVAHVLRCHAGSPQLAKTEHAAQCLPFLMAQVKEQQPKALLVLGQFAANVLLNCEDSMQELRAKVHPLSLNTEVVPVVVTHDLDHILKRPEDKAKVWEDLLKLKRLLA